MQSLHLGREIFLEAVVNRNGNVHGFAVGFCSKPFGKSRNFGSARLLLCVFDGAFWFLRVEFRSMPKRRESAIVADVVVMCANQGDDGARVSRDGLWMSRCHAGVEQDGLLRSDNQIRNRLFRLVRFVNANVCGATL